MDSSGTEMSQIHQEENTLPNIDTLNSGFESQEIETFQTAQISMLCLKCSNHVSLKNLQDHRSLHEALSLYKYDFKMKPTNEQTLSQKRGTLIKDLNKLLNISRSAYLKELGKIDLAYEVIKSDMYGRFNKVKPSFIEHHDVIITSARAKLHEGLALGVCESTNEKWKSVMEDAYSYKCEFTEGRTFAYFAVFDGYSGQTAAKKCSSQFYPILKVALSDFNECNEDNGCYLSAPFQQAFEDMDKVLLLGAEETSRNRWSGCSATTCLLTTDTLHVANVGNVKALLIRDDDSFHTLTEDHSPGNKKEKHRIKASGDIHRWSKTMWVNGVAMTTRGLGNHGDPILKSSIINVPAVCCISLAGYSQIILVASYGFWQVFDENEVAVLIKEWLKRSASGLGGINSKIDVNNCNYSSNSIQIFVLNEDVLNTGSSDKDNQMKEQETFPENGFQASENWKCESDKKQCSQCMNNSTTCVCIKTESLSSNTTNMNQQDCNEYDATASTMKSDEQIKTKEGSLLELLRNLVMRYDSDVIAVEIGKHLTRAALTGGAKENITVMVVIRSLILDR